MLEVTDQRQQASFVHDPYKGGEGEGRIIKTLRWVGQVWGRCGAGVGWVRGGLAGGGGSGAAAVMSVMA